MTNANENPILTKENFLKIFDLVKMLKKNIIQVQLTNINDQSVKIEIYGTDSDFSSVSYIDYVYSEPNNPNRILQDWGFKDIGGTIIYNFEKNNIVSLIKEDRIGYVHNNIIYDQLGYQSLWIGNNLYKDRLYRLFSNTRYIIDGVDPYDDENKFHHVFPLRKIYEVDDILKNTDIAVTLKMKAAEGANMVNINNNILTMYGGMYPITSKDKASLELYESSYSNSIISVVTINKPKDIIIKCIIRYRSLID